MDQTSYAAGMKVAEDFKARGVTDIDATAFAKGMADVLAGTDTQISSTEATQLFQTLLISAREKAGAAVKEAGEKFLAENAKRKEVTTTSSGLQYEVLEPSDSQVRPGPTDEVKVHYHGTLIDGTVFDSSVDRGEPISFPLNRVIAGWTEGLQLMNVGSKYRLFIPYNLAYGTQGSGGTIKPYAALIFDVSLLGVN